MTTTQPHHATADHARWAELDAARLLLDRMGITPADLLTTLRIRATVPTFAQYVPRVRDAVGDGTRRVYGSYWNRVIDRDDRVGCRVLYLSCEISTSVASSNVLPPRYSTTSAISYRSSGSSRRARPSTVKRRVAAPGPMSASARPAAHQK